LDKRIFSTIFKLAEIAQLKKEDQMVYRTDWMREMDRKAVLDYAKEEGMEEGMEKGLKKGREEGRELEKIELVRKLINEFGFTVEQAAKASELSVEKVREILE